ncbi:MAG: peptide chain release factor 1 [Acidimicrobiales bacterium]
MTLDPDRFGELEREYEAVLAELSEPDVAANRKRFLELSRRLKRIEPIVRAVRDLRSATEDVTAARELVEGAPPADRELARAELESQEARVAELEELVAALMAPRDENDGRNVIVTIRGAEGGAEANLFARDLFAMYQRYADRRHWKVDVLSLQESSLGGIDEVTFVVKGDDAWSRLKHEGGTHRVQRVPVTESQGRVHTSSATVTVLPEADEVDVDIEPADLRIDVYRSTGPGGQSVNTTDSAVRITHIPTGLVVAMQDEKSQIQNRAKAMQVLRSRLLKLEQDRLAEERARETREQIGAGGRADKIRTYNFKENRVTDHRIGLTLHRLDKILEGDLDEIVEALVRDERGRGFDASH